MGQKLSSLVFNGPRAKTKTVLEMAYKMDPKSSIIQSVSACWCRLSLASMDTVHMDSVHAWTVYCPCMDSCPWASMDNCPCMDIHKTVHAWTSPCTLDILQNLTKQRKYLVKMFPRFPEHSLNLVRQVRNFSQLCVPIPPPGTGRYITGLYSP